MGRDGRLMASEGSEDKPKVAKFFQEACGLMSGGLLEFDVPGMPESRGA